MNIIPAYIKNMCCSSELETLGKRLVSAIDRDSCSEIRAIKIDVNRPLPCGDGELPLIYAVKHHKKNAVLALLDKNADPKQQDHRGFTALECAILTKNKEIFARLLKHVTDIDIERTKEVLAHPASRLRVASTAAQITKGIPKDEKSRLAFEDSIRTALRTGPFEPNAKERCSHLHLAILCDSKTLLESCLNDKDARFEDLINKPDKHGWTPLHYAAALQRLDLIKLLCAHQADIHKKDSNGLTPLDLVGAHAETHSPLALSRINTLVFIASVMMWTTNLFFLKKLSWHEIEYINQLGEGANYLQYWNSFSTWKGFLVSACLDITLLQTLPEAGYTRMAYQAYTVGKVAFSAINGLTSCWRNRSLGTRAAVVKAVVDHLPKLASVGQWIHRIGAKYDQWKKPLIDTISEIQQNAKKDPKIKYTEDEKTVLKDVVIECFEGHSSSCSAEKEYFGVRMKGKVTKGHECDLGSNLNYYTLFSEKCTSTQAQAYVECLVDPLSETCAEAQDHMQNYLELKNMLRGTLRDFNDISYTHRERCGKIFDETVETCYLNSISEGCEEASRLFKEYANRAQYYHETFPERDVPSRNDPKEKINFRRDCAQNLESSKCIEAEVIFKEFLERKESQKQEKSEPSRLEQRVNAHPSTSFSLPETFCAKFKDTNTNLALAKCFASTELALQEPKDYNNNAQVKKAEKYNIGLAAFILRHGVTNFKNKDECTKAFRTLQKRVHPDKLPSDQEIAESASRTVTWAREILCDKSSEDVPAPSPSDGESWSEYFSSFFY